QHELVDKRGVAGVWRYKAIDWGIGVDIFFVISGFVMYYLMHDRFGSATVAGDFLRRRLIRVVPLYWICTTLVILIQLRDGL
ncbi:acyltransferase family protein, partial [Acinetobacter baumannii]